MFIGYGSKIHYPVTNRCYVCSVLRLDRSNTADFVLHLHLFSSFRRQYNFESSFDLTKFVVRFPTALTHWLIGLLSPPPPLDNAKEPWNSRGWEKLEVFDRNRRLSLKQYEIGPWLLWITNRKSWATDRSVSVSKILSDLEKRNVMAQIFLYWLSVITFVPFDLERPNLAW